MMYEFDDEEMELIKEAVMYLGENTSYCGKSEQCDSILESVGKQEEDDKSLDKIRSYKPMRRLNDAMWEVLTDEQEDVEKYLPAGKTIDYVIVVTDKEDNGDSDEEDLTDEILEEITNAVTHAMWDMFGHQPDDDVVIEIVSSVKDRKLADPEANIEDLVDQEILERYIE